MMKSVRGSPWIFSSGPRHSSMKGLRPETYFSGPSWKRAWYYESADPRMDSEGGGGLPRGEAGARAGASGLERGELPLPTVRGKVFQGDPAGKGRSF